MVEQSHENQIYHEPLKRQILNCISQFESRVPLCFFFVLENNVMNLRWSI